MSMPTESQTNLYRKRVLLFVRAPQRGHVKTRLAKQLGADKTLALYRCFVEDIIATLKTGSYQTSVFYTPADQGAVVQAWLGKDASCQPQTGLDLGQRMQKAFANTYCGPVEQAILIGSDFPDLDIGIIHEAFSALQKSDVVIGPARDGGYYLIGFQKDAFKENVFRDVDWGTSRVFQQTLGQIQQANLNCYTLPAWQDVDTYKDLMDFFTRNAADTPPHLKTMTFLTGLNIKLQR